MSKSVRYFLEAIRDIYISFEQIERCTLKNNMSLDETTVLILMSKKMGMFKKKKSRRKKICY